MILFLCDNTLNTRSREITMEMIHNGTQGYFLTSFPHAILVVICEVSRILRRSHSFRISRIRFSGLIFRQVHLSSHSQARSIYRTIHRSSDHLISTGGWEAGEVSDPVFVSRTSCLMRGRFPAGETLHTRVTCAWHQNNNPDGISRKVCLREHLLDSISQR